MVAHARRDSLVDVQLGSWVGSASSTERSCDEACVQGVVEHRSAVSAVFVEWFWEMRQRGSHSERQVTHR